MLSGIALFQDEEGGGFEPAGAHPGHSGTPQHDEGGGQSDRRAHPNTVRGWPELAAEHTQDDEGGGQSEQDSFEWSEWGDHGSGSLWAVQAEMQRPGGDVWGSSSMRKDDSSDNRSLGHRVDGRRTRKSQPTLCLPD